MTLKVKRLDPRAKLPTVAHPGEDLGFDLFALEDTDCPNDHAVYKIRTGVALEFPECVGGLIRDRSSMAAKGVTTHGGVIDNGYRGEIIVLMRGARFIHAGDKIAQIVPIPVLTSEVEEVTELGDSARQDRGFGSSGK